MRKMTTFLKLSALGALFLGVASLYSCKPEPPEEKLDAPTGLDVKNLTSVGATLTWATVEGATLYNVEINGAPETSTTTSYTINTLAPETDVTWRVQAVKGETKSAWTDGQAFRTPKPTIPDPTDLRQADVTPTSANFTWVAPAAGGVDKYRFRIEGGSLVATPAELTVTNTSVDNLEPGVAYNWAVQSMIGTYEGAWINHSTGFTTPAVSNPTNARASEVLMESATLTWTAGQYATEYVIKSTQFNGGNEIIVTGNTHRVDGLAPKTNYTWQIQGKLGDYRAPAWVDGAAFTTVAAQTPLPTGLEATEVTYNSAKLSWQHADADKHEVKINNGEAIPVTGLTYTATGLESETSYTWQVRSAKDDVWSDWATAAQPFETGVAPRVVSPPTDVRIDMTLTGVERVAVRWTPAVDTDVNGYWVQIEEASKEYDNSGWLAESGSDNAMNAGGDFKAGVAYKCRVMSLVNWTIANNLIDWDNQSEWVDVPTFTIPGPDPDFPTRLGNYTATGTPSWFTEPGPSTWSGAVQSLVQGSVYRVTNAFNGNVDLGVTWANLYITSAGGKLMLDDGNPIATGSMPTGEKLEIFAAAVIFENGEPAAFAEPGQIEIAWDAATRKFTFPGGSSVAYALAEFTDGSFTGWYSDLYMNLVMTVAASGGAPQISGTRIDANTVPLFNVKTNGVVKNASRKVTTANMGLRSTYSAGSNSKVVSKRTNYVER